MLLMTFYPRLAGGTYRPGAGAGGDCVPLGEAFRGEVSARGEPRSKEDGRFGAVSLPQRLPPRDGLYGSGAASPSVRRAAGRHAFVEGLRPDKGDDDGFSAA